MKEITKSKLIPLAKEKLAELNSAKASIPPVYSYGKESKIRVLGKGDSAQYYLISSKGDTEGKYIPKKDFAKVQKLIVENYNEKVLKELEREIKSLERFLSTYDENALSRIHQRMSSHRQKSITPVFLSDDEYVKRWIETDYRKEEIKHKSPAFETDNNEKVRSKSELIIANLLNDYKIPYRYEYPIRLKDIGWVHPDFYCLNPYTRQEFAWEHLGMMDDYKYSRKNVKKINSYIKNGFYPGVNLILTFETESSPLDITMIKRTITQYLYTPETDH